jgi:hypothetical protein
MPEQLNMQTFPSRLKYIFYPISGVPFLTVCSFPRGNHTRLPQNKRQRNSFETGYRESTNRLASLNYFSKL